MAREMIDKLGGIPSHPDQQIPVVLWMGLGVPQGFGGDAVKLHMKASQGKKGLNHAPQIGRPRLVATNSGLSRRFSRVPPEWTSWLSLALERIAARGVDWSVPT